MEKEAEVKDQSPQQHRIIRQTRKEQYLLMKLHFTVAIEEGAPELSKK